MKYLIYLTEFSNFTKNDTIQYCFYSIYLYLLAVYNNIMCYYMITSHIVNKI